MGFGIRKPRIWHLALLLSSGMARPPFSEDTGFHSVPQQSTKFNTPWNIYAFMHSTGILLRISNVCWMWKIEHYPNLTKTLTLCILNSNWRKIIRKPMNKQILILAVKNSVKKKNEAGRRNRNAVGTNLKSLKQRKQVKQAWGRAPRLSTQHGKIVRPEQQGALYLHGCEQGERQERG